MINGHEGTSLSDRTAGILQPRASAWDRWELRFCPPNHIPVPQQAARPPAGSTGKRGSSDRAALPSAGSRPALSGVATATDNVIPR